MAYSAPTNLGAQRRPTAAAHAETGVYRAFHILQFGFTVLPIVVGIDKFFNAFTSWDKYLAPVVASTVGLGAHVIMMIVGGVEIVAGLVVAFWPRVGSYLVALWLLGIMANLAINPVHYWDLLARDFGLFLGALALGCLSSWVSRMKNPAG